MAFIHCRSLVVLALAIASIAQAAYPSPTYVEHARRSISVHDQEFQRRHNGNEGQEGQFSGPDNAHRQHDSHGSENKFPDENRHSHNGNGQDNGHNQDDRKPSAQKDAHNRSKDEKKADEKKPSNQATKVSQKYVDDGGDEGNKKPTPSQRPRARNIQRRSFDSMTPSEIATAICPGDLSGCPIAQAGSNTSLPATYSAWLEKGFECVDFEADLRSCGGCASLDIKHDCTAIPGALDVACDSGTCVVHSCKPGFTFNTTTSTCTCNRK